MSPTVSNGIIGVHIVILLTNDTSPLDHCNSCEPPVHCVGSLHGIPPCVKYMGPTRCFLAGQRTVSRLYCLSNYYLIKHGRIYSSLLG